MSDLRLQPRDELHITALLAQAMPFNFSPILRRENGMSPSWGEPER